MRVLVVKTSSMGDIIQTLPSLTDAIQNFPNIIFDWVIEEEFSQIPTWHIAVNKVISVNIRRWLKSWFSARTTYERNIFKKKIKTLKYNVVIDAQGLLKSAVLVTRLACGVKHGLSWQASRESLASFFYDKCHFIERHKHAIERTRELFAKSLNYKKPQTIADYSISNYFLENKKNNNIPYAIFIHSTTCDNKLWPEIKWRKLIKLIQNININIKIPWYNEHELERAKRLATGFNNVKILPKLSLTQIAKKLAKASLVVSVDTGLSHLAAAFDRPNITLFGPTNPKFIYQYGKNQYQVVSPTQKMCDIIPNDIFNLIRNNIYAN